MNKLVTTLLVIVSVVAIGASLYTTRMLRHAMHHQEMGRMFEGRHFLAGGEPFGERREEHLRQLHDALQLTPAQESGWKDLIAKLEPGKRPERPDWQEMSKLSVPDRMDKALSMMKEREARLTTSTTAVKQFYATLKPEQQTVFNEQFAPQPMHGWGDRLHRHERDGMRQGADMDRESDDGHAHGPDAE